MAQSLMDIRTASADDVFENMGRMSDTIISFVLDHAGNYLFRQNAGGLHTKIKKTDILLTALRQDFETHAATSSTEVFERENIVALLQPDMCVSDTSEQF